MRKARILFLLCLVAALAIGMAVTASAEEATPVVIDYITITMELPYVNDPVDVAITDFTATAHGNGQALPADAISMTLSYPYGSGSFSENEHMLSCEITVKAGYQLAGSVAVQINESGNLHYITPAADGMSYSGRDLTFMPRQRQYTDLIVETLPVPAPGAAIAPYSYTHDDGSYTITGTWYVYDYQTQTASPATGNFEDGKLYQLNLTATAAAGWQFGRPYLHVLAEGRDIRCETSDSREMTVAATVPCGEMEVVREVPVLGLPEGITAGGAITVPTLSSKYGNANITAQWLEAERNPASGTFQDGKVYYLQLTLTPMEGFMLGDWTWVSDNEGDMIGNVNTNGTKAVAEVRYSLLPKVGQVDITGVTGAVIGQAPTTSGIKAPENVHYTLDGAYWRNESTDEEFTAFADGNKYRLRIYVAVADGYEFTEDTVVTVNGEVVEEPYIDHTYIEIPLTYSFLKQIDKVDITVPAPEIGQTATLDGIVLPEGLELDTNDSYWYENVTEVVGGENHGVQKEVEGAFQKGHKYYLHLNFYVKAGYELTDDAELYCNGNLADGYNETYGNLWESGGYMETCYSFREIINKVEVTGVPTPVVGQTATTEGITITGVGEYEIYWMDEDAESDEPFTGKFETGKAYYLRLAFDSAEGTEFGDNCIITVNGEKTDDGWFSNEGGDLSLRYSFKQVIDKIEITGLPQFAVGATASVGSLKAPEGANYTVIGMWNDPTGDDSEAFTGTFKADGTYVLFVGAEPKEGYEFAEDLQFLIDGKAPETAYVYIYQDGVVAQYYFAPSYEEVGKLELTVQDPVIGETFKSGDIETPENVKYTLYGEWFISTDGENWTRVTSGTFEEGKYYALMLYVELRSDEVWFGNNPQISINGVDVVWDDENASASPMYVRFSRESGKLCAHTYGDWTSVDGNSHSKTCSKCGDVVTEGHAWHSEGDVKCSECGYEREINPPTGDMIVSACLLALCSAAALVVIKRRRIG